ncbi:Fic family protein [Thermodesulfobacteriota bacterium]
MKMESFKAGNCRQQYHYQSFTPSLVNHGWTWDDPKINTLLEYASRTLSELNAFSLIVPDVDLFIQMHIVKEANTSSRIEGTRTQMDEAVMDREQIDPDKRDDWQEVQNYIHAMNEALDELPRLPLSNRLLKRTHDILLQGVRGEHKLPGEFRRSQNWIGGTSLKDAVYIPPGHDEVPALMADLEKFWHNDQIEVPHLIRIAISHYQFETIHPFLDGNGRIGRLLITLYLMSHGILDKPSLYLSDFFERNRSAYYDALTTVRLSDNIIQWIKFFLTAIIQTAEKGQQTFRNILILREQIDGKVITLGRKAANARKLILSLYQKPVLTGFAIAKILNVTPRAANALINDLERLDILKEQTGFKRNRIYAFEEYLMLFRG